MGIFLSDASVDHESARGHVLVTLAKRVYDLRPPSKFDRRRRTVNINELRKYENWIGQRADVIYSHVRAFGGWESVFPGNLPRWASKVRNYFNIVPASLTQVTESEARAFLKYTQKFKFELECHEAQSANRNDPANYKRNPDGSLPKPIWDVTAGCPVDASNAVKHTSFIDSIAVKSALTKYVYRDENGRLWFQMAAGSTIYHWGAPVNHLTAMFEAIFVDKVRKQEGTPAFKLVNPDPGVRGSNEVIIRNPDGRGMVGAVKQKIDIRSIIVKDPVYQGSYNYAETSQVGLAAHERLDVKPHSGGWDFYVNPSDPFSALKDRTFPREDVWGKPLAGQN